MKWSELASGIIVPFFVWAGFVATAVANQVIWEGKCKKLYALAMLQMLVSLVVMGVIALTLNI